MEKVIQPEIKGIYKFFCDAKNCKEEAVSRFQFNFGYGSDFDLDVIKGDFCNKHSKELRKSLLAKYKNLTVISDSIYFPR